MNEFLVRRTAASSKCVMKLFESVTPQQLRRAADLKERIQSLSNELERSFGGAISAGSVARQAGRGRRQMSPAAKAKLSAKLKAIWAKRKAAIKR